MRAAVQDLHPIILEYGIHAHPFVVGLNLLFLLLLIYYFLGYYPFSIFLLPKLSFLYFRSYHLLLF